MAAKSDGAAVSVEDDIPPRSASESGLPGITAVAAAEHRVRAAAAGGGKPYTLLDCCWVLCALLVFFSDGATDLWLAADYYLRDDYWWFGLTLVFVVVPSAVVQVLSFRWFVYDYSELSGSGGGGGGEAGSGTEGAAAGDKAFSTKDRDGAAAVTGIAANATPLYASSVTPVAATAAGAGGPRRCCTVCMWVFQTVLHVLQLGQVWR
ncbi:unnamed protein product [Ophioblennius macclurei]